MCDRVVSEDYFLIVYYPDKYKTQGMCDEAAADSLAGLKFVSERFVTSKVIKKLYTANTPMIIYSILMKILVMS